MEPQLEDRLLKNHYEGLAQQHLDSIKNKMLEKEAQTISLSKSLFFSLLIGEQVVDFYKDVNQLRNFFMTKNDASIDEILSCFLHMHRVGEYFRIGRHAIELDIRNPNEIQDKSFWESIKNDYNEKEVLYRDCVNNLLYVLNNYVGVDWQLRIPKVTQCFEYYVNSWKANIDLE